jgi:hypothetical protein
MLKQGVYRWLSCLGFSNASKFWGDAENEKILTIATAVFRGCIRIFLFTAIG